MAAAVSVFISFESNVSSLNMQSFIMKNIGNVRTVIANLLPIKRDDNLSDVKKTMKNPIIALLLFCLTIVAYRSNNFVI